MKVDIDRIVSAIRSVVPDGQKVVLHEPELGIIEQEFLRDCVESTFVSSVGAYVDRFERALTDFTGARRAVAVVNGTAALHLALEVAGVRAGDEVIVPTLTFVATANAVSYCGARPHFSDSSAVTLGLDAKKLEEGLSAVAELRDGTCYNRDTGARISAVVPMHAFGHPTEITAIVELADRWGLTVVEDAAESLGSFYGDKHTGRFGRVGTLSFNGNKIVTTGGGGAVITDDEQLAHRLKHLSTTAKVAHKWAFQHDEIGYNYRMPNLNAALGCAQMKRLPSLLVEKKTLADRYRAAFMSVPGVVFVDQPFGASSNFWLNTLMLDDGTGEALDVLLARTNEEGIMTRPVWNLMHRLPMYRQCPRMDISCAENLERRLINIPSSAKLGRHAA